jgi:septum formation protein
MSDFILASSSHTRLELLEKARFVPKQTVAPSVDEAPLRKEKPLDYLNRISKAKANAVAKDFPNENVLAADSIVVIRNQIVQKPKTEEELKYYYEKLYSGRRVKALTGVCFLSKNGLTSLKIVESKIKFKHLNEWDITTVLKLKDVLLNCAGGISIEILECITKGITGSYSNIRGLPLYEVRNLLLSNGVRSDSI